jgi:hypothetical protein
MIEAKQAQEVEQIRDRMRSTFSNAYLTLLSIIQGTALATLFLKVDYLIGQQSFHMPQLVMSIGLLLTIILLWNQYQMGVSLYSWTSQLFDAFIPFSFGIAEFSAILGLEHGSMIMLIAFGTFFTLAIIAFEHQYWQLRRSAGPDAFVHRLTRGFRRLDVTSCVVSAAIFFATAALLSRQQAGANELLAAWVLIAVAVGQGVREAYFWRLAQQRIAFAA